MSKVIYIYYGFVLPNYMIGLKSSCNSVIQSTLIVTRSLASSRASRQLQIFSSSFDWFIGLLVSYVFGQSDNYGFGLSALN